jgi:Cu/Ag efflux protein CusF
MSRVIVFACCAVLLTLHVTRGRGEQTTIPETKPVTVTATIEAIDKATRTVTLKRQNGTSIPILAPDEMEGFNSLRVGDVVTATYFEALAVNVRKPGDPAPSGVPSTTTRRKDRTPGSETRREQTFTVTIEAIDPKTPAVTVKGPQGRVASFLVRDPAMLQKVKVGDTVDVTYYESLLIKVSRGK